MYKVEILLQNILKGGIMENNQRRILLNMAYFTLIGLAVVACVFFILRVSFSNMLLYVKIIYYIWAGILILNLAFDIICTINKNWKFISGIIFFVLTLLCVVMAVDVFFMQGVTFKAITSVEITYFINISLSFMPIYLGVFAFLFGEKLVNFDRM